MSPAGSTNRLSNMEQKIDLKLLLAPVSRRWKLILTFCVAAVLTSLALTYVVSEKYRATSTILYQPNEPLTFRPRTRDALGFPTVVVGLESIGSTLEDVLRSDALLGKVVTELHLDQKLPPSGTWLQRSYQIAKNKFREARADVWQVLKYGRILPQDNFSDAVAGLRDSITLKRTAKAYTFEIQVVDSNPQRAALVVDTISKGLANLLAAADARSALDAQRRLMPQVENSANELARIRSEIDSLKSSAQISSLDQELTLKLKNVSSFEEELAKVGNELHSLRDEQVTIQQQLNSQPQTIVYSSTTSDNPVSDSVKKELASLEIERAGLLENLTVDHPKVKAIDARIAEAREKLGREQPRQVSAESSGINEVRQKLLSDKFNVESQIAALSAKQQALIATVQTQTDKARHLSGNEAKLAAAQLELAAAEKNYELTNEAFEEARLAEANVSTEVMVLSLATIPTSPILPIKIYHVGATLLLSLLLGSGFAFLADYFDPYLRKVNDVELALDAPVLASIPATSNTENMLRELFPPPTRDRG
jgi:uncharacterized protein involved in exopolysaccharide biosynthesis